MKNEFQKAKFQLKTSVKSCRNCAYTHFKTPQTSKNCSDGLKSTENDILKRPIYLVDTAITERKSIWPTMTYDLCHADVSWELCPCNR